MSDAQDEEEEKQRVADLLAVAREAHTKAVSDICQASGYDPPSPPYSSESSTVEGTVASKMSTRDRGSSRGRDYPTARSVMSDISNTSSEEKDLARIRDKKKKGDDQLQNLKDLISASEKVWEWSLRFCKILFIACLVCYGIATFIPGMVKTFLTWAGALVSVCGACSCANQNRSCQCVDGGGHGY